MGNMKRAKYRDDVKKQAKELARRGDKLGMWAWLRNPLNPDQVSALRQYELAMRESKAALGTAAPQMLHTTHKRLKRELGYRSIPLMTLEEAEELAQLRKDKDRARRDAERALAQAKKLKEIEDIKRMVLRDEQA